MVPLVAGMIRVSAEVFPFVQPFSPVGVTSVGILPAICIATSLLLLCVEVVFVIPEPSAGIIWVSGVLGTTIEPGTEGTGAGMPVTVPLATIGSVIISSDPPAPVGAVVDTRAV